MNINIPDKVKHIMTCLKNAGYVSYVVGGAVRDSLMYKEPHDWDLFTGCPAEVTQAIFPTSKVIGGEERQEKILTVMVGDIEVSEFRKSGDRKETGKSLVEHQKTCDFTINSLACNLDGALCGDIDLGLIAQKDIKYKILRFVGNPIDRLNEDKLRALRGIRFALKYNLDYDDDTYLAIHKSDLSTLHVERIQTELIKILSLNYTDKTLLSIQNFLPKDLVGKNMLKDGGYYHNETPYVHSNNAFKEACNITSNPLFRLAALLHDVGKNDTRIEYKKCPLCDGEII